MLWDSIPVEYLQHYALHCELSCKAYCWVGQWDTLIEKQVTIFWSQLTIHFSCVVGLERDKFDNKTVTFEEHIKEEHNMWHYLFFIVLVKVKDSTEYTGPESYVAEMIKVELLHKRTLSFTLNSTDLQLDSAT